MSLRARPAFLVYLALFTLAATLTAPAASAVPPFSHPPSPPKWETPAEKAPSADALYRNAAFRLANPQLYAITDPPVTPVKIYAEHEAVSHVYYVWWPGYHDDFFWGITNAVMQHGNARVALVVEGTSHQNALTTEITNRGGNLSLVDFIDMSAYVFYGSYPTDSYWMVDYGPYWVLDGAGTLAMADPRYYFDRTNDDAFPSKLADMLGTNVWRPDMDLEGGNMISDGNGTCILTSAHLFRNFPVMPYEMDEMLWQYMGCEKVIWVDTLVDEGTGHIDMFTKMLTSTTLIVGEYVTGDPTNATVLNNIAAKLAGETNAQGQPFTVVRIPMPSNSNRSVWRTYTNSIIVNNVVIVPTYANETTYEAQALAVYQSVLPSHTIVGVDSDSIIPEGGAVHCVTRTRPVGTAALIETAPSDQCSGEYDCPPTSGCGTMDYTGMCIGNTSVWCDTGTIQQTDCGSDICAWDVNNDYVDCIPTAGCGSYTAQGSCFTDTNGVTFAIWCDSSYAQVERCGPAETCGTDAVLGRVACSGYGPQCTDDCSAGDTGCSTDSSQRWTCGEAGDGDTCLDYVYTSCAGGETCSNGVCSSTCTDECSTGDTGCSTNGSQQWTCGESGDGDSCLEQIYTACGATETCTAGACQCVDECATGDTGCSADSTQRWTCAESGDGDTCLEMVFADCDAGTQCANSTCPTTCADECSPGETGCSLDGSQQWTCGEAGDGDTCAEPIHSNCAADASCENGACTGTACTDECLTGESGCSVDGAYSWICGESGNGDTCTERIHTACPGGQVCAGSTCQPGTPPNPTADDSGCGCQASTTDGPAPSVLLILLLGLLLRRRRRR